MNYLQLICRFKLLGSRNMHNFVIPVKTGMTDFLRVHQL